jgi:hypothetical protein
VQRELDRLFSRAQILRMLRQIRQRKANEVIFSERFIRVKGMEGHQALAAQKTEIIAYEAPAVFRTIGRTSSSGEGYLDVCWDL